MPIVKPKTTIHNKNEFNIILERPLDEDRIDSKKLFKPILNDWENTVLVQKLQII